MALRLQTPFVQECERCRTMDQTQAIWIKDPLAILADGAERGIVVQQRQDRRTGAARAASRRPPTRRSSRPATMSCCRA